MIGSILSLGWLLTALVWFFPLRAHAVTNRFTAFDLWPSPGERYFFAISSAERPPRYSLGVSNQFVYRPFDLLNPATGARLRSVVNSMMVHFLSVTYGVTDNWNAGLILPVISHAQFEDPTVAVSPGTETVTRLGDLRLTSKVHLAETRRWGLAVEPFLGIPLGADDRYLGDSNPIGGVRLLTDLRATDRILLALNLGTEFREAVVLNNIDFRHRFLSGFGVSGSISPRLVASAEMQANTSFRNFFSERDVTPLEFLGGIHWDAGKGFQIGVGGGTCGICGARGARLRTVLNLDYRRPAKAPPLGESGKLPTVAFPAVYFGFNEYRLTAEMVATLEKVVELLSETPSLKELEVTGHTDSVGSPEVNHRFSVLRAEEVVRHLKELGAPESVRFRIVGRGEAEPDASNLTREGRASNRRVTFEALSLP